MANHLTVSIKKMYRYRVSSQSFFEFFGADNLIKGQCHEKVVEVRLRTRIRLN
jgi:hypothetical protein